MGSAASPPADAPRPARELGVDLARGLALVSMFVAHAAPSPGPLDVLAVADHLTFPLFALLVGVGAELGARGRTPVAYLVASGVRATALFLLGWLLARTGAQVVVVLAPLGVLVLGCWALVRCSSPVVAAVGLLGWALAPWSLAVTHEARWRWIAEQRQTRVWLLDLVASTTYPLAFLVACAATGVLATRWLHPARAGRPEERPADAPLVTVTLACVLGAALLGLLDHGDHVAVVAYSASPASQTFSLLLAAAVLGTCELVARHDAGRRLTWLAYAGAMTLTLYVLHVLWLAYRARLLAPGELDDSWTDLAVLVVGALVLAALWHVLARTRALPYGWRRGPLEGALDWTTRALLPDSGQRPTSLPGQGRGAGLTGTAGQGPRDG